MQKLAYVVTAIIFIFSVVGTYSNLNEMIAAKGQFVAQRILLCILGIITFVLFMLRKRVFALLNVIWFLPQTIVLSERFVDPLYDAYAERTVYDMAILVSSVFVVGVEKTQDVFVRIGFNMVGIAGLMFSILIAWAVLRNVDFLVKRRKDKT
jgi:hypothetical protein